jgi:cephalosporin hydroxylase
VRTLRQRSTEVGWEGPIALLFVDGLHDYASVSADYQHFEKYVVPGGVIAFHDYAPYYAGVMQFVDELVDSARVEMIAQVGSMIVVQKRDVVREFHDMYWNSGTWRWTFWQGIPTLKCPLDLWVYQELLWLLKPRLIVELGTFAGGTANFLASLQDLYASDLDARVLTVDVLDDDELAGYVADYHTSAPFEVRIRPRHPRIHYIHGDSVSADVVEHVKRIAEGVTPVMVIADSDHSFGHTYQELLQYHHLVTPGSWFIMEDTDGPGPRRAVDCFLQEHPEFSEDATCEKFHMTFNPRGYLRRS